MLYEWLIARSLRLKTARQAKTMNAAALRSGRPAYTSHTALKLGPGEVFVLGALAKIGATVVTYPMIVVKSRLQAIGKHTADENRCGGCLEMAEKAALPACNARPLDGW